MQKSYMIKGIVKNRPIRILAADTKDLVEEARNLHKLYPTSAAALGRVLSIVAILVRDIKNGDGAIQVEINGGGPIGTIFVHGNSDGTVKGKVGSPDVYMKYNDSGKLAVGQAVGKDGYLKALQYNSYTAPFTSQVELQTGEIGDDFAYYFATSQQTPAIVSVGVLVDVDTSIKSAGALICELLPGHEEADIEYLEDIANKMAPISSLLAEGKSIEDICAMYFEDFELLDKKPVSYQCECDRERFLHSIRLMKPDDLNSILESEEITVQCEFCNTVYRYTHQDILEDV